MVIIRYIVLPCVSIVIGVIWHCVALIVLSAFGINVVGWDSVMTYILLVVSCMVSVFTVIILLKATGNCVG